jgi:hypothetical protein
MLDRGVAMATVPGAGRRYDTRSGSLMNPPHAWQ